MFNCSNGSFPNPLDWWRIRFGCTALDQCYWNKEKWFANWCVGVAPSLICCWRNTFTTDTVRKWLARPPPPPPKHKIDSSVHTRRFDRTSQNTKLRLWPLDHSSSDVWRKRRRLNVDQLWAGDRCILRRHPPVPEIKYSRQKTTRVDWRKDSAHIGEYNASHYWIFLSKWKADV